ncbi:MAG: Aminopeptidase YpdF [Chlamydiae bacterium]|nr:Aminopeptidase YpdF [Chlamydiota bacterium]
MTQSKLYLERIKRLQTALKKEGVDTLFVEASVDLFYLTGLKLSRGHLFVQQKRVHLFVDGRYFEVASKKSPVPVQPLTKENEHAFLSGSKKLGFDGDQLTYTGYTLLRKVCTKAKVKSLSKPDLVKDLRLIKDKGEIAKMKKSAAFGFRGYQYIRRKLKVGISEIELARALEIYCLKNGAEKMSFEPIIAFGKNTALPHHHPGKTRLKENDIALFDLGVVLDGYASDMTRVDFVGKVNPTLRKLYDVNRAAQKVALAKCRPGVPLKELDIAARRVMASADLENLFVHTLGHGIGLEVHEHFRISKEGPDRNIKLEEGMVLTIEPGLYLPGKGGVRYEDTISITAKGYTNFYPES